MWSALSLRGLSVASGTHKTLQVTGPSYLVKDNALSPAVHVSLLSLVAARSSTLLFRHTPARWSVSLMASLPIACAGCKRACVRHICMCAACYVKVAE